MTTVHYLIAPHLDDKRAKIALQDTLKVFSVAVVDQNVIQDAVGLGWSDFEDAAQMAAAARAGADYLITRNPKDFINGPIDIVQPGEFLALLRAPRE